MLVCNSGFKLFLYRATAILAFTVLQFIQLILIALFFSGVHGNIGKTEQIFCFFTVIGEDADADTGSSLNRMAISLKRRPELLQDAIRDVTCFFL